MLYKCFDDDSLEVTLSRRKRKEEPEVLVLDISSDYSGSERKQQLYVDEKAIAKMVEDTWKAIKTKMLLDVIVDFDEIDQYDNMTNIYRTPVFAIKRGLRKAKIGYQEHGSIPKEWAFTWSGIIKNTNAMSPLIDILKNVLSVKFDSDFQKRFEKMARPVLQGKKDSITVTKRI